MIHYDQALGLTDLPVVVDRAIADLRDYADEFDSIVVQGVSGAILGTPVALALGKQLVVVRKDSDMQNPCYHVSYVENARNAGERYLFLDDYVGEGKTLRDVRDKMRRYTSAQYAGRYETAYKEFTRSPRPRIVASYAYDGDGDI